MAGFLEINGEVTNEFNYRLKPHKDAEVLQEALDVSGVTHDQIMVYPPWEDAIGCLKNNLACYCNRYDKNDKFVISGFGIDFDYGFVRELFTRSGDKYGAGSWIFNCTYDVRTIAAMAILNKGLRLENYKQKTFCDFFGIEIDAHDALSDIRASYLLNKALIRFIKS